VTALLPLSRRDRAAMELTLCHLRALAVRPGLAARQHTDFEPLRHGGPVARDVRRAIDRRLARPEDWGGERRRAVRCTLALLLRVLLRADAGDMGPDGLRCSCGRGGFPIEHAECEGEIDWWRGYRPLWEQAAGTRRARRAG
jgi:hypothetical protein